MDWGDHEKALLITIADTGTGRPLQRVSRLFKRLFTTKDRRGNPLQEQPQPLALVTRECIATDDRNRVLHITAVLPSRGGSRHFECFHQLFDSRRDVSGDNVERLFKAI
jgi:hypothetical protein